MGSLGGGLDFFPGKAGGGWGGDRQDSGWRIGWGEAVGVSAANFKGFKFETLVK